MPPDAESSNTASAPVAARAFILAVLALALILLFPRACQLQNPGPRGPAPKPTEPSLISMGSQPPPNPAIVPKTTTTNGGSILAVFRVRTDSVNLLRASRRPQTAYVESFGPVQFCLFDAQGSPLLEGRCTWPRLCDCPELDDHQSGCIRMAHSSVARIKLPWHPEVREIELFRVDSGQRQRIARLPFDTSRFKSVPEQMNQDWGDSQ